MGRQLLLLLFKSDLECVAGSQELFFVGGGGFVFLFMLEGNSNSKLESGSFAFPNIPSYSMSQDTFSVKHWEMPVFDTSVY